MEYMHNNCTSKSVIFIGLNNKNICIFYSGFFVVFFTILYLQVDVDDLEKAVINKSIFIP